MTTPIEKIQMSFGKPELHRSTIIHILLQDQRKVLTDLMRKRDSCKCRDCGAKNKRFGFVYISGSKNVVTGITEQCQDCGNAYAYVFEPIDSLNIKIIELKENVTPTSL